MSENGSSKSKQRAAAIQQLAGLGTHSRGRAVLETLDSDEDDIAIRITDIENGNVDSNSRTQSLTRARIIDH